MIIEKFKVVSVSYTLTSGDEVVETVDSSNPMTFMFGTGSLLPKFEENLEGKKPGDKFDFSLSCEDAYGEIVPEAIIELAKEMFKEEDGVVNESLFQLGTIIPLRDNEGNRFDGKVVEVKENSLMVDLNHPLAGKSLHFVGEVLEVREATEDEQAGLMGGCSCGSDCSDSSCSQGSSTCGCGCGC